MKNDDNYGWPTSRCFPRTLKDAFKDDPENTEWWFPPPKRGVIDKIVLAIGIILWLGVGYYFWKAT